MVETIESWRVDAARRQRRVTSRLERAQPTLIHESFASWGEVVRARRRCARSRSVRVGSTGEEQLGELARHRGVCRAGGVDRGLERDSLGDGEE